MDIRIGCAGWTVPKEHADSFPAAGSHLQRYAGRFRAVEINSSFYRPHRAATYARWAATTPEDFLFSVKIPKEITHARRLVDSSDVFTRFLGEVRALGKKLGALLVQSPPSLGFDAGVAARFFEMVRMRFTGEVAFEPRHKAWFEPAATRLLARFEISRVAADPAVAPGAENPDGWLEMVYYRLHGSPDMYYSSYGDEQLADIAGQLSNAGAERAWCIFDNTARYAAQANALQLVNLLQSMHKE
jgi:uncharacterized protein YecE (DUF72 family)